MDSLEAFLPVASRAMNLRAVGSGHPRLGARLLTVVIALAALAGVTFMGVGIHELDYASSHPHAYGPAKVIAWSAFAGAALAFAVALMAFALLPGISQEE